jgi:hypothetical protein
MHSSQSQVPETESLTVIKCDDFKLTGDGGNKQWSSVEWAEMLSLKIKDKPYDTRFKIMHSATGIYVLGECQDRQISTSYNMDQGDIWNGDVFEVFLQTDPGNPLYFEYEINPLGAELAILVPNNQGDFFGWSPWHYEGDRKVQKAVKIHGGKPASGEKIEAWTVEIFFPYTLFKALKNVPPEHGTKWKANFCRIDYDGGAPNHWAWKRINKSFHEYQNYGTLVFQ